jgi:hypothetical protein
MAQKKVTIDDLREAFDKVRPFLADDCYLLPLKGDESKCVLVQGNDCATYSCRAMKGHLAFVLATVVSE